MSGDDQRDYAEENYLRRYCPERDESHLDEAGRCPVLAVVVEVDESAGLGGCTVGPDCRLCRAVDELQHRGAWCAGPADLRDPSRVAAFLAEVGRGCGPVTYAVLGAVLVMLSMVGAAPQAAAEPDPPLGVEEIDPGPWTVCERCSVPVPCTVSGTPYPHTCVDGVPS